MARNIWFNGLLIVFVVTVVVVWGGTQAYASQIERLELSKLPDRAQIITLAEVVKVQEKSLIL